ncbi:Protein NipSnap-like protein 3B [Armadillidium vulgare]|nr:Protein NipSnap-like protein 3B [Armadillidium vulgare]
MAFTNKFLKCLRTTAIAKFKIPFLCSHPNFQISENIMNSTVRSYSGTSYSEVYEMRHYNLYPDKMKEFLSHVVENFGLRVAKSVLLGFWVVELGGMNQVIHLWPYEKIPHRFRVRSELTQDVEWNKFLKKVYPLLQCMDNTIISSFGKHSPQERLLKDCPYYEIQFHQMTKTNWSEAAEKFLNSEICNRKLEAEESSLVGAFKTICGQLDTVTLLWQHKNPEGITNLPRTLDSCHEYKNFGI